MEPKDVCNVELDQEESVSDSLPAASTSKFPLDDDAALLDPGTEEEQVLVNRFLDGEMNFSDYFGTLENDDDDIELELAEESKAESKLVTDSTEVTLGPQLPKVPPKRKYKKTVLTPALSGLMGEANLRYARGEKDTAVKICLEIIRQVPTAPEPFQTLASIFDEMGDQEKFLQMSLVAAHLSSTDFYEWIHLGELSEKLGHIKQARTCYTKALKIECVHFDIHLRRAALFEKLGDRKTPLLGFLKMLTHFKPEKGEELLTTAKQVAEICHKENDIVKASRALEIAFEKCPHLITVDFANLQLELLIQLKEYMKCLDIMAKFCGLEISMENNDIIECTVSPDTPADIVAKLIIVLVHLKCNLFVKFLKSIIDLNPTEAGDLYLDVIDALVEEEYYAAADTLLAPLVSCESYSLPAVWLKYAENLKALNRLEDAVKAYNKVIEQAPQHSEARSTLGSLLMRLGRKEEALSAVAQDAEYSCLDVGLLYERCLLLKEEPHRAQQLIAVGHMLLSRHSLQIRNKDELTAISVFLRGDQKRITLKQLRRSRNEPEDDIDGPLFKEGSRCPTRDEEWDLFKYICNVCMKTKAYTAFQRLTFSAQMSKNFNVYKKCIDTLSVIAAYYNRDPYHGYNIIRILILNEPPDSKLWHLFNLIITRSNDSRHHRYIMRRLAKNCDHPALVILHGNNCLVSGTYKYAMHEYSSAFVKNPHPLTALLLGVTYLQMAGQKFTSKKHQIVVQGLGHMYQYRNLRGPGALQEVHYNLGRGFHHLGLYSQSIFHYKKVLEYRDQGLAKEQPEIFDLSKEAAFNLHLIYLQSESYDLARMYIEKYIVI